MSEFNQQPQESGITSELESFIRYTPATQGQRFINWLIDNLLMQFGLSYLTGYVVGYLLSYVAPAFLERIVYQEDQVDLLLLSYLIGIFNYLFYYTICEKAFRGYTLGKLLSGSRAIRLDGNELTLRDAFLRSLSRLVPFEPFSGFGIPWHDSWTKTGVIKTR